MSEPVLIDWREWREWGKDGTAFRKLNEVLAPFGVRLRHEVPGDFIEVAAETIEPAADAGPHPQPEQIGTEVSPPTSKTAP